MIEYTFLADFSYLQVDKTSLVFTGIIALGGLIAFITILDLLLKDFKDNTLRIFWLIATILTVGFAGIIYWLKRKELVVKTD